MPKSIKKAPVGSSKHTDMGKTPNTGGTAKLHKAGKTVDMWDTMRDGSLEQKGKGAPGGGKGGK